MSRTRTALGLCTAALLALTVACGTTEDPAAAGTQAAGAAASAVAATTETETSTDSGPGSDAAAGSSVAPSAGAASSAASSATGPVEITDGRGTTLTLEKPATRVVALEWGEAETLASLGVMPVGVADLKGYTTWDVAEPMDSSVKDVGTRSEPSIDAILALKPDLVVITGDSADQAKLIGNSVPVLVTKGTDPTRQLDRLRDDVTLLAAATGTEAAGEKLLADMDSTLVNGKAALAAAGNAGDPFLMADGWKEGSAVAIRVFAKGSQNSDVAEALGLKNAWTGKGDAAWGLAQTDVEGMAAMTDPALRLFYSASEEDVFVDGLAQNPIWKSLPFVKSEQLTKLRTGTWTFGGPASVDFFVEQVLAAYGA
ncbi:ABC transporter substrate-binding protein [Nakamurella lactea]|uniref:ABC transporter substrate-binding protein n=1 Tax=Nakamurella lactea TaxID=459515 RepID=UPI000403CEAF|nr:ABC transporter substrate-binding protein [Nakamurella lactea]